MTKVYLCLEFSENSSYTVFYQNLIEIGICTAVDCVKFNNESLILRGLASQFTGHESSHLHLSNVFKFWNFLSPGILEPVSKKVNWATIWYPGLTQYNTFWVSGPVFWFSEAIAIQPRLCNTCENLKPAESYWNQD